MKALLVAFLMIAPLQTNWKVYEAIEQERFIEEEELVKVKVSCYLATGNKTADGSVPHEGIISCNKEHLGQDCIVYNEEFLPIARFECRDIGGHKLLREGKAIDIYRDSLERAQELVKEYGPYIYIKWVPRDFDGCVNVPGYAECLPLDTD